jgi:hypothetical protein
MMNLKDGAVAIADPYVEEQTQSVTEAPASDVESAVLEQVEAAGGQLQERKTTLVLANPETLQRSYEITDECIDMLTELVGPGSGDALKDLLLGVLGVKWQVDAVLAANGQLVERVETFNEVIICQNKRIAELMADVTALSSTVEQLKTATPQTGANRFNRQPVNGDLHAAVLALPGFERCSGMQTLKPGEKCNAHQHAPGAHGCCPTAFQASKMLANNVPVETIAARFGPKAS